LIVVPRFIAFLFNYTEAVQPPLSVYTPRARA